MNRDFKKVLNEVNRINDLMRFNENKEIINESFASALKYFKTLIKNGLDDIAKYGIKEIDNIARSMISAKNADEFFELLDSIKFHDTDIAKQLRRDVFDILPEATQNRIIKIVKELENNLDNIPENRLDGLLDDIILEQFPNEPESVRRFMKDSITDSSSNISNKLDDVISTSRIQKLIDDAGFGDDVIDEVTDEIDDLLDNNDAANALKADMERYKRVIKNAKRNGSIIKEYKFDEWQELWEQWKDPKIKLSKQQMDEIQLALKDNSVRAWYRKLTPARKVLFWSVTVTAGPTILGLILTGLVKRFTTLDDIDLVFKTWDYVFGNITKLTEKNITEAIISEYNVDEQTFSQYHQIYISKDKQSARVRGKVNGADNYKVTIVDKEIVIEKQS